MRIIGGAFKSRRFQPPKQFDGRPTTDFAREALFNILNNELDFEDLRALDLYAGVGGISFELASRGAAEVVSVDQQSVAVRFIEKMSEEWGMDAIWPEKNDAVAFSEGIHKPFDFIFADPPYSVEHFDQLHERLFKPEALNPDGLLVFEHGPRTDLSHLAGFYKERRYGHVHFSFFYPDYE